MINLPNLIYMRIMCLELYCLLINVSLLYESINVIGNDRENKQINK